MWKLFESDGAPRRGVVCLITNRTFLAGHPYAGLRRMLRRRFDMIDIIDLRGDSRGARPTGIEVDENVFAIQAGVCITIAVATGAPRDQGAEARVSYADVWRHAAFTAREKQALLEVGHSDAAAISFVDVARPDLADFVAAPFQALNWPALPEIFGLRSSGIESKRDDFVYAFSDTVLLGRWRILKSLSEEEAGEMFHETPMSRAAVAVASPLTSSEIGLASRRAQRRGS